MPQREKSTYHRFKDKVTWSGRKLASEGRPWEPPQELVQTSEGADLQVGVLVLVAQPSDSRAGSPEKVPFCLRKTGIPGI